VEIYVENIFNFHISLFLWSSNMIFFRCVDFTRIAASYTASGDVTN